jgi:hypothetical protein
MSDRTERSEQRLRGRPDRPLRCKQPTARRRPSHRTKRQCHVAREPYFLPATVLASRFRDLVVETIFVRVSSFARARSGWGHGDGCWAGAPASFYAHARALPRAARSTASASCRPAARMPTSRRCRIGGHPPGRRWEAARRRDVRRAVAAGGKHDPKSSTALPGSCTARGLRHDANAADNDRSSPPTAAVSANMMEELGEPVGAARVHGRVPAGVRRSCCLQRTRPTLQWRYRRRWRPRP